MQNFAGGGKGFAFRRQICYTDYTLQDAKNQAFAPFFGENALKYTGADHVVRRLFQGFYFQYVHERGKPVHHQVPAAGGRRRRARLSLRAVPVPDLGRLRCAYLRETSAPVRTKTCGHLQVLGGMRPRAHPLARSPLCGISPRPRGGGQAQVRAPRKVCGVQPRALSAVAARAEGLQAV